MCWAHNSAVLSSVLSHKGISFCWRINRLLDLAILAFWEAPINEKDSSAWCFTKHVEDTMYLLNMKISLLTQFFIQKPHSCTLVRTPFLFEGQKLRIWRLIYTQVFWIFSWTTRSGTKKDLSSTPYELTGCSYGSWSIKTGLNEVHGLLLQWLCSRFILYPRYSVAVW